MQILKKVQQCSKAIKDALPEGFNPVIGLVLGTGLGGLAKTMQPVLHMAYKDLPDFPLSTVYSHTGQFICGYISDVPLIMQQGRCHLYEGYTPQDVVTGVRVMGSLGITSLVLTNAAGALNPQFSTGDLMVMTDHINFTGQSPLTGQNHEEWGPRFPDMSQIYDRGYIQRIKELAGKLGIRLESGVYFGITGPEMETPAETRAYRNLGGDAIGMSTVLEAIAAHHMGLHILGISCLTNKNLPDCMEPASLENIIEAAEAAGSKLTRLLENFIRDAANS